MTEVRTGCRSSGGVKIVDISRIPEMPISSVRGMGVADMASTSTSVRSCLRNSLCSTPNRCSSSMISRPSLANRTSGDSSRCVPITMSTLPAASPSSVSATSLSDWNRDIARTVTGNGAYRSVNVAKCWADSKVVGTSTATCSPSWTALNAARTAISVLP